MSEATQAPIAQACLLGHQADRRTPGGKFFLGANRQSPGYSRRLNQAAGVLLPKLVKALGRYGDTRTYSGGFSIRCEKRGYSIECNQMQSDTDPDKYFIKVEVEGECVLDVSARISAGSVEIISQRRWQAGAWQRRLFAIFPIP